MRLYLSLLFLTLVLSGAASSAAPQTTTTMETSPLKGDSDPHLASYDSSMIKPRPQFYIQSSVGFAGGNYLENSEYNQAPFLALRYIPMRESLPVWDYQIEVSTNKLIGLSIGRRWYCCPEEEYMPYVRASASTFLDGAGELGGITAIRRWRLRGSLGLGETFTSEFGVGYAITGPDLFAQFGYNFAF